jgi:hypothetical protein
VHTAARAAPSGARAIVYVSEHDKAKTMSTPDSGSRFAFTLAVGWIMVWAIAFVGLGFNHAVTRHSDSPKLFLVGTVLAAFVVSLWLVSLQPTPRGALVVNRVLAGAVVLTAALLWRNVALLVVRWSPDRQHSVALIASWVWVALVWLSIVSAGAVAEVHHVLHSRAR